MGWLGKRSGAAAATPPRASPPRRLLTSDPGGTALPITAASGATYRSLTHRNSSSITSSKNRTGETTFLTPSIRVPNDSEGPSTHPRIKPSVERHLHERPDAGLELGRRS